MSIVPAPPRVVSTELKRRAQPFLDARRSANTKRAYGSAWRLFTAFCEHEGTQPLPATSETVADYILGLAERKKKVATIALYVSAISAAHKGLGHDDPTKSPEITAILEGVRRKLGTAPTQKKPLLLKHLKKIIPLLPRTLQGKRDRAMLLTLYAGGFRRDELVRLDVGDLKWGKDLLEIRLRKSKTDQTGKGFTKFIPRLKQHRTLCAYTALKMWLSLAGISSGFVFREVDKHGHVGKKGLGGKTVAIIVKRAVKLAGLDPREYSGHSGRAGVISELLNQGEHPLTITKITGHQSLDMLARYDRESGKRSSRAVGKALGG